jgi:hypothetical protein
MTDGRNLLTVENGVTAGRNKRVTKVVVDQRDGTIAIFYDQDELIHTLGGQTEHVNPTFKLMSAPEDTYAMFQTVEDVADLCVQKFGAPHDKTFDIVEFLRESVAPYYEKQKERTN